jgi:ABC-type branched-subunit amino acid transport system substrate-binding protein
MWRAAASWALLLIVALAGCRSVDPVVKVGLVAPFEGRDRAIGYDAIYSARLAVREINAAGGINGRRLALVALDDGGDEDLARQAAATLVRDPAVVAVVGHFLPATTAAAAPVYANAGLPLLAAGSAPLAAADPATLPAAFRDAYAAVSPFDEVAGPFAGPTYDAFNLLWAALAQAEETAGRMDRASVQNALLGLEYAGLTGSVRQPTAP